MSIYPPNWMRWFVRKLYTSASDVVREALRLMEQQDYIRAAKLEQLRHDIRDGIDSGESTRWDPEEIKQEGRKIRAARINATKTT